MNEEAAIDSDLRFSHYVQKGDGCWLWMGARDGVGYGIVCRLRKVHRAHRWAWRLLHGSFPSPPVKVCHRCDVRNCVRPAHLFLGTQADNVADMMAKGRHRSVPMFGERNPMARLSEDSVRALRERRARTGESFRALAEAFGVSTMTAFRAATGRSWQ